MNRFYTKKIALFTSLLLMGSILVACDSNNGSNNSNNDSSNSNSPAVTTKALKPGEVVQGELNSEVSNEDIAITLKNTYKIDLQNDSYDYVGVYVEITNNSDVEHEFSNLVSFGVREKGSDTDNLNLSYPPNAVGYVKKNTDFNILRGTVAPNTMLDGIIVIAIPKGQTEVTLVFYPNITETTGETLFTITTDNLEELPLKSE